MEKNYQIQSLSEEKIIIGMTIRTTNQDGKSIQDTSQLWKQFYAEGFNDKVQGKVNPSEVLGVYSNYESDCNGYYDYTIGYEVSPEADVPEGFGKMSIPKADYAKFELTEALPICEKIKRLWNNVWQADINRKYSIDFEIYDENTAMSENPKIQVFITVK